jgi:hypothetical protein
MKKVHRDFHASDLLRALDAQPHELRSWLQLEPLASREKTRRSATAYSALDALFLAVVKQLDAAGFAPKALQTFSASLYKALQHPPAKDEPDELLLYLKAGGVWRVGHPPEGATALELRIPLQETRLDLLRYTGAHLISPQLEMVLLAAIQNRSSRGASSVGSGRRRASR